MEKKAFSSTDFTVKNEDLSETKPILDVFNKQLVVAGYAAIGDKIKEKGAKQLLFSFEDGNGMISFELFREVTDYKGEIWVDLERNLYNQLGCHKEGSSFFRSLTSSVFGKSSKYLATANLEGDYDQQGGQFILTPEADLFYAYQEKNAGEFDDFPAILKALDEYAKSKK